MACRAGDTLVVISLDRLARSVPKGRKNGRGAHVVELVEAGEHSGAEIADLLAVSRPTIYRAVKRAARTKLAEQRQT